MLQKVWVWIYVYQVLHALFVTQWKCQLSKGKFSNFPNEKFLKHVHDCLSDRLLNFPSHSTRPRTSPELEIFVLWILKSSLFVNLQINLFFILTSKNVFKIQPIKVLFAETNQQIRSRDILNTTNERTLIGRNTAGISKRKD